jgi:hypothetical protein
LDAGKAIAEHGHEQGQKHQAENAQIHPGWQSQGNATGIGHGWTSDVVSAWRVPVCAAAA